jgi:transmembrane sensor
MTPMTPKWEMLLNEGSYQGARKAIESEPGGFDAVIRSASPDQLLSLADIARATGLPARALQALRRVVDEFPGDPSAPLAAYTLGKELEKAGDKAGAARAFDISRRLSPKGSLAEDALARQVEAAVEQGNVELARQLADEYAKDFPKKSRRLSELRAQIAKLTGEPTKAAAKSGAGATSSAEDEGPSEEPEEPSTPAPK